MDHLIHRAMVLPSQLFFNFTAILIASVFVGDAVMAFLFYKVLFY